MTPSGASWAAQVKRWAGGLSWRRDVLPAVIVLAVQLGGQAAEDWHRQTAHLAGPAAARWLLLVAGPLALLERRRHPVAVLWVTFAITLFPAPNFAYLSLIVAFFVAATTGHRRAAWLAIVLGFGWAILSRLVDGHGFPPLTDTVVLACWLAVLVIAAEAWRMRTERVADARAVRQLEERRRISEERLRMARDLHDVIGHTMSVINVQAGVGLDLMDSHPEQAAAALAAIKAASKDALDELRTMLVALRQDGEQAPRSPASGLERLPELIELSRAAGLPVTTEITGEPRPLPAAADLAAYRIIQESLTNVTRHAGRATAVVRLTYQPDDLRIDVIDDGRGAPPGSSVPAGSSGNGSSGSSGNGSSGNGIAGIGIAGMRERVSALGGSLDAAPRPGGGFTVTAHLPLGESGASRGTTRETPAR